MWEGGGQEHVISKGSTNSKNGEGERIYKEKEISEWLKKQTYKSDSLLWGVGYIWDL